MRLSEIILIVVIAAAALLTGTRISSRLSRALTILAAALGIWHMIREGFYWQMLPAIAGLLLLALWQLSRSRLRIASTSKMKVRVALVAFVLCAMSIGLLVIVPMFVLPKPTGPYPVGTRTVYLSDPGRIADARQHPVAPRELMVQIWYPADPSSNRLAAYQRLSETSLATSYRSVLRTNSRTDAPVAQNGGPFPVLLFNHGWAGRRTQNTFLAEELASHGYVVASIDHTYNSVRVALPGNRIIDNTAGYDPLDASKHTAAEIKETWNHELKRWVDDEVFVLNCLQDENNDHSSVWYGRLDTARAGALGHSFGGAAAIEVGTVDPRIQSALNLDGWTFGDTDHRAPKQSAMMFVYEASPISPQGIGAKASESPTLKELDASDESEVEARLKQYGGYRLYVNNTSHMDFTDNPLINPLKRWRQPGHISATQIQNIVRAYVLAFFNETIRGQRSALLAPGDSTRFREVQVERWSPAAKPETVEAQPSTTRDARIDHP